MCKKFWVKKIPFSYRKRGRICSASEKREGYILKGYSQINK